MGYGMTILMVIAIVIGIGVIFTGAWIFACLYQTNKRDKVLTCSCGKQAKLLWNDTEYTKTSQYIYVCSCGVQGFMGLSQEEAFYGWTFRGNRAGYMAYITAKHGN